MVFLFYYYFQLNHCLILHHLTIKYVESRTKYNLTNTNSTCFPYSDQSLTTDTLPQAYLELFCNDSDTASRETFIFQASLRFVLKKKKTRERIINDTCFIVLWYVKVCTKLQVKNVFFIKKKNAERLEQVIYPD